MEGGIRDPGANCQLCPHFLGTAMPGKPGKAKFQQLCPHSLGTAMPGKLGKGPPAALPSFPGNVPAWKTRRRTPRSSALIPWEQQCWKTRKRSQEQPPAVLGRFPAFLAAAAFPGSGSRLRMFGFSKDPFIPRESWKQRERGKARERSSGHGRAPALIPKKPGYPKYSSR